MGLTGPRFRRLLCEANAAASLSATAIPVAVFFPLLASRRASFVLRVLLEILPRVMVDVAVFVSVFPLLQVLLVLLTTALATIRLPLVALAVPPIVLLVCH
jgi:hypothetical protein